MQKSRTPTKQTKISIRDQKSDSLLSNSKSLLPEQIPYQILKRGKQQIDKLVLDGKLNRFFPEKTAIARQGPSGPAQFTVNLLDFHGKSVLDFGCGKSSDAVFFQEHGAQCWIYDPFYFPLINLPWIFQGRQIAGISPRHPTELFDIVTCIFVLNVVVERERVIIADQLLHLMKPTSGKIIIGVREDWTAVKNTWVPYDDGYINPSGTFQSFFHPVHNFGQKKLHRIFPNNRVVRIRRGIWLIS